MDAKEAYKEFFGVGPKHNGTTVNYSVLAFAEYFAKVKDNETNQIDTICDGCNVKDPWEHRCFGEGCGCDDPVCMNRQGRITHEELMEIVNKHQNNET